MKDEIVLYRPDEIAEHIEVRLDEETVWLTQKQMALVFDTTPQNITLHLNNVYEQKEIDKVATCKYSLQVQMEGKRKIKRKQKFYNLDAILSVGYRVNSIRGTQFRQWATQRLKDYLLKGYAINNRMNRIEDNVHALSKKVNEIDLQINTRQIPTQGIFYDGEVFDAYELASKIIRSAETGIVLIVK